MLTLIVIQSQNANVSYTKEQMNTWYYNHVSIGKAEKSDQHSMSISTVCFTFFVSFHNKGR